MSDIGKRLKNLIKSSGLTNKKFAEMADVAPNYISILIRTGEISDKFKYTIKKVIPSANITWLETGKGEMLEKERSLTGNSEKNLTELKTEDYLKVGQHKISLDEFALIAAQNIEKLKKKPVFYNTFVMEALNLLREAQNESGVIDPMKLTSKE